MTLTDALKIEPATMTVPAGVPVTFVVTNSGATDHEFYLGDEAAQAEHEKEMAGDGRDDPRRARRHRGEARRDQGTEIHLAQAGEMLAGCHVVGHYGAGMKAAITVTG